MPTLHPSSFPVLSLSKGILHPSPRHHRAFTFAEIMFAVMILGVGFIMVAAMFPVAIRQTQSTLEDLSGVAEAKRGEAIMRQLGASISGYMQNYTASPISLTDPAVLAFTNLEVDPNPSLSIVFKPGGASLYTFSYIINPPGGTPGIYTAPYQFVKGDLINQLDHRFAWIPVAYQVDQQSIDPLGKARAVDASGLPTADQNGAPVMVNGQALVAAARVLPQTARVWIVAVEKRNPDSSEYTPADRDSTYCFRPTQVYFKLVEGEDPNAAVGGNTYPDTIVFTTPAGVPTDDPAYIGAADTGAYVWVSDDNYTTAAAGFAYPANYQPGTANGRFYRLGSKLDATFYGPGVWELQPGNDMQIKHSPGVDAFYNSSDDATDYELENLPPRAYDTPHPYSVGQSGYGAISGNPAKGLMIGKGLKNPAQPYSSANPYIGSAQDVYALPPVTITLKAQ